jgi:hypothetical protein
MTALPSPEDFTELAPGWTRQKKAVFLDHLAQHGNVRAACARVGLSRDAAYRLRRRDADFARGWGAAMVLANDAGTELLAACATEGVEHRVYFHGELVDTYRRIDARLLLAHLGRLDKAADDKQARADAARFDELLAVIGGAQVPDGLEADGECLPADRKSVLARADLEAAAATDAAWYERDAEDGIEEVDGFRNYDAERFAAYRADLEEATIRARGESLARWHAWLADACGFVDGLLDDGAEFSPRTVSDVSTAALAAGLAAASPLSPRQRDDSATSG